MSSLFNITGNCKLIDSYGDDRIVTTVFSSKPQKDVDVEAESSEFRFQSDHSHVSKNLPACGNVGYVPLNVPKVYPNDEIDSDDDLTTVGSLSPVTLVNERKTLLYEDWDLDALSQSPFYMKGDETDESGLTGPYKLLAQLHNQRSKSFYFVDFEPVGYTNVESVEIHRSSSFPNTLFDPNQFDDISS